MSSKSTAISLENNRYSVQLRRLPWEGRDITWVSLDGTESCRTDEKPDSALAKLAGMGPQPKSTRVRASGRPSLLTLTCFVQG